MFFQPDNNGEFVNERISLAFCQRWYIFTCRLLGQVLRCEIVENRMWRPTQIASLTQLTKNVDTDADPDPR